MSSRRAERRHFDLEDLQPVDQVLAEAAGRDEFRQRPVGRRDHAEVRRSVPGVADRRHLAALDRAEQLDLRRQWDVADLVEQDRPAVGELQQPLPTSSQPGLPARHPTTVPARAENIRLQPRHRQRKSLFRWPALRSRIW